MRGSEEIASSRQEPDGIAVRLFATLLLQDGSHDTGELQGNGNVSVRPPWYVPLVLKTRTFPYAVSVPYLKKV